jgi:hypothetical protein
MQGMYMQNNRERKVLGEGGPMRQKEIKKNACSTACRGGEQCTKNKKQGVSIMTDVVLFSLLPPNEKKKKIRTVLGGASRNLQHKQEESVRSHSF